MKPCLQVAIQITKQWANIGFNMNTRVSVYKISTVRKYTTLVTVGSNSIKTDYK